MKKIFIHMGPPKTGSTSIQATFFANKEILARNGIAYLSGDDCDVLLTSAFYRDPLKYSMNKAARLSAETIKRRDEARIHEIDKQIRSTDADVIFVSSEHLPFLSTDEFTDMKTHFEQYGTVSVIYFIREIIDWLGSNTQELARVGGAVGPVKYQNACNMIDINPRKIVSAFGHDKVHFVSFSDAKKSGLCDSVFKIIKKPTVKNMGIQEIYARGSISEQATKALFVYNNLVPTVYPFRDMKFVDRISELPGDKYKISGFSKAAIEDYRQRCDGIEAVTGITPMPASELPVSETPDQFAAMIQEIFDRVGRNDRETFRPRDIFTRRTLVRIINGVKDIVHRRKRITKDSVIIFAIMAVIIHYFYLVVTNI